MPELDSIVFLRGAVTASTERPLHSGCFHYAILVADEGSVKRLRYRARLLNMSMLMCDRVRPSLAWLVALRISAEWVRQRRMRSGHNDRRGHRGVVR